MSISKPFGNLLFLLLTLFLFSAFASPVLADDLPTIGANLNAYQPPTGNQCNINVPSQFPTIQTGIDAANVGDTVCVGPGTYNENVAIVKTIRLSGRGPTQTIINGPALQVPEGFAIFSKAANVVIEGFLLRSARTNNIVASISQDDAIGVTFQYNWVIAGNGSYGLLADNTQTNELIQHNVFEGNNAFALAIILTGDNNAVLNNTFIGTSGGILISGGSNGTVKRNVFNTVNSDGTHVATSWTSVVNENNFNSDVRYKVYNYPAGGILNAENNWWGSGITYGGEFGVDYIPYALSPFPEYAIPVLNQPPVANAGSDQTVFVSDLVSFNGSLSSDPDGNQDIVSYNWNFGDSSTGSGITTTHAYSNSGTYTVTLSVTDHAGASGSDTLTVTVQTPTQATQSLIDLVQTFNIQQGITNSLDVKLNAAIGSLNDLNQNNNSAALNSLQAFINAVNAQRGNKITDAQADTLIQEAQEIINHIS